ncbi:MAG: phosphoribosyltransferase family protein [Natronomonas sp.]|jgi:predicted phosphoribosyltransferase|uniref:phosphoribosyltransferase n=1 Tax=Natronomonas sp. TaxID=2184060 RepID=UPI00286FCCF2|nr:phosphoribosyltransferase family protein [Natronomonas sp.]MDR9430844.1 phosphoribosyltransferase family protein [Natronomonas sp.]
MFADRTDAGRQLADVVAERDLDADMVLAIPRGGLPVGRAVADGLGVALDVVAARKLGAPSNPELAIGAVASDGTVWRNDSLIEELGVSGTYVEATIEREREVAREKADRYRGGRSPPDVAGRTVLLVDDGIATGATAIACIRSLKNAGVARVVVAVPVASPETVDRLHEEADDVLCVETPVHFGAVGAFYHDFEQVTDEEAMAYLEPDE